MSSVVLRKNTKLENGYTSSTEDMVVLLVLLLRTPARTITNSGSKPKILPRACEETAGTLDMLILTLLELMIKLLLDIQAFHVTSKQGAEK